MKKDDLSTSRRKFIKGLGGGALITTAATVLSQSGCSTTPGAATEWSSTYDWICVGSGIGGLAPAIAGHDKGMKTLLLEKTDMIGGTTAQASGGGGWTPMNYLQKAAGIQDSREKAVNYLSYVSGGYAKREYMEAYVDNAARVMDYLHQKAEIEFTMSSPPGGGFYDPVVTPPDAGVPGRGGGIKPFPAETLGAWRDKVRLSLWYRHFNEALQGPSSLDEGPARTVEHQLEAWKKRLGPEKFEALVRQNEEYRVGGAGYVAYLFRAILKRGVEVRLETEVERLLEENGRVVGVAVNQKGKRENIRANKGVLLALGNSMLAMDVGWGPGWMLAAQVGGKIHSEPQLITMVTIHVPGEVFPNGKPAGRTNYEKFMRHSLFVNRFGERFDREAFYSGLGRKANRFDDWPEHRFQNVPNFLIFDRQLLEKHSFGGMPPGNTEGLEWVSQGGTLAELARKMKLPVAKLEATVARFNEFARRGKDLDFDRAPTTLGTIEKPPFYGVETSTPDPFETLTTVVTNPQGQVLHYKTEQPISGLYCCGALLTTSRIWGMGYQGGLHLGGGATFGFLAAEHAVTT